MIVQEAFETSVAFRNAPGQPKFEERLVVIVAPFEKSLPAAMPTPNRSSALVFGEESKRFRNKLTNPGSKRSAMPGLTAHVQRMAAACRTISPFIKTDHVSSSLLGRSSGAADLQVVKPIADADGFIPFDHTFMLNDSHRLVLTDHQFEVIAP